jgi:DNA replication protein DnaC
MKYLMENSNIPLNRQKPDVLEAGNDFKAFCELADIKDNIVNFVENGDNLYITSEETGNGKTAWAIKLMLKYFNEVWAGNGFRTRGIFIHTPTFLTKLKDFNNKDARFDDIKEQLTRVDLVVWDDIGANELSQYDHTQLLTYIDQRVLEQKSNIYTGNLNKEELEKSLGTRLASRVWNTSMVIEFKGKDRRS